MPEDRLTEFEQAVRDRSTENLLTDFMYFLRNNKKWWLLPFIGLLLLLGGLMMLSSTAAAPLIYTLF